MEDLQIIELYFERNETAIAEDAEECVNDTYLQAWNSIPPQRPNQFRAGLGRVVRNITINLWRKNHCQKRYAGMEQILDELEECIPSPETVERQIEEKELTQVINAWLTSLCRDDRVLFVRRYWNGETVNELAKETGTGSQKLARRMYSLRQKLKAALEKEGYSL